MCEVSQWRRAHWNAMRCNNNLPRLPSLNWDCILRCVCVCQTTTTVQKFMQTYERDLKHQTQMRVRRREAHISRPLQTGMRKKIWSQFKSKISLCFPHITDTRVLRWGPLQGRKKLGPLTWRGPCGNLELVCLGTYLVPYLPAP